LFFGFKSAQSTRFSITINLPSTPNSAPKTLVLEAEPQEIVEKALPQPILLVEGDEYEYAGDDYL